MQLQITTRDETGGRVLAPAGELDIATAATLQAALEAELAAGPVRLVIDLSRVSFLDSSGLGALVAGHKAFDEQGVSFSIASASERIQKVFRVAGLTDTLGLSETVAAALARP